MDLRSKRTPISGSAPQPKSRRTWLSRRRRQRHDPMLVLSMSNFNFMDGWERILNPTKSHEHAVR
jgi:hypothetical protein